MYFDRFVMNYVNKSFLQELTCICALTFYRVTFLHFSNNIAFDYIERTKQCISIDFVVFSL